MSPSRDRHILPPAHFIRHRSRADTGRQRTAPQLDTGFHVERFEVRIERRADEHQPPGCHNRPTQIDRTELPTFREHLPQWHLPLHAASGRVDRVRRTRNLFYVSCSRSKNNLAVIDLGGSDAKKDARVKELFGADNSFL